MAIQRLIKAGTMLLALLALVVAACGKRPVPAPPTPGATTPARVVALSPAVAAILRDVGLGDRIVGRHAWDIQTDPGIPVCGEQTTIDFERLIDVKPTHVFLQMREIPPKLVELSRARGFIVKNYTILSLEDIRLTARELWNWNGASGTPGAIEMKRAPIEARMDTAWSRRAGIDPVKVGRVLLLAGIDPPGALGPGSWHDDILRRIGGTPAIPEGAAYITLDKEDVLRLAPDAIVLLVPRDPSTPARTSPPTAAELVTMLGSLGELNIPAVRNARIALIDDPMCQVPGTGMIGVADELGRVLEGWSH